MTDVTADGTSIAFHSRCSRPLLASGIALAAFMSSREVAMEVLKTKPEMEVEMTKFHVPTARAQTAMPACCCVTAKTAATPGIWAACQLPLAKSQLKAGFARCALGT